MPHAKLTVTLPPAVWIGALSREFPEATFRVLSAIPRDDDGVGLVELSGAGPAAVLASMAENPTVTAVEPVRRDDDTAVVQFETTEPLLLLSAQASGMPLSLPLDIGGGRASLEVTASRDRIAALGEALEELGLSCTLDGLYESVEAPRRCRPPSARRCWRRRARLLRHPPRYQPHRPGRRARHGQVQPQRNAPPR